jgi:hypothetical protein
MSSSIESATGVAAVAGVAGVAARLTPEARRAARIVAQAFRASFYDRKVPGAPDRTLKNLEFHALQQVYVEAAHQTHGQRGAVIVANRTQLRRVASELAKREFNDDRQVPSGTVGAMVSHWQALFRTTNGCIASSPIRVGRSRYVVRFSMTHEDTGQYRFWLDVVTTRGTTVVETCEKSDPEVHLLQAVDETLARQTIENRRALLHVARHLAAHPLKTTTGVIFLSVVLTFAGSERARAAAADGLERFVKWVGEFVTGRAPVIDAPHVPDVPASAPTKEPLPLAPASSAAPLPASELPSSIFTARGLPSIGSAAALNRLFEAASAPDAVTVPYLDPSHLRAAIHEVIMRDTANAQHIKLRESAYHPYAGNITGTVLERYGGGTRMSFNMRPLAAPFSLHQLRTFKWSFLRILPDGRLEREAVGVGRTVVQDLDAAEAYVVLGVAESEPVVPPGRGCGTQQFFESGLAVLLPGVSSGEENVLQYVADEYNFQPFVRYTQQKGASDHRAGFAVWPGHIDPTTRELFIDFGDGTSTYTDFTRSHPDAATMSLYDDYWFVEHEYRTAGAYKIVVKVLDNTGRSGHPNHPVLQEFAGTVDVK